MSTPIVTQSPATEQVRTQADRPQRPTRIPFGAPQTKLAVRMELPGYFLYWTNDQDGKLEAAQAGGYEFVTPKEIGEARDGTQVKRLVGSSKDGSPLYAYLMKIKQEWHQEDLDQLSAVDDKFESAIREGSLLQKPGEQRYNAGISLKTNKS